MSRNKVKSGLHISLLENKCPTSRQSSSLRLWPIICCQEREENETEEQRFAENIVYEVVERGHSQEKTIEYLIIPNLEN